MRTFLCVVAALHAVFMACELFPWSSPFLLQLVSRKLPEGQVTTDSQLTLQKGKKWTDSQLPLVTTIVQNAGIYNAILAGGLLWAALPGHPIRVDVARALLLGAAVAGIFGTVTLKSPLTAVQALLGIIGLALV